MVGDGKARESESEREDAEGEEGRWRCGMSGDFEGGVL